MKKHFIYEFVANQLMNIRTAPDPDRKKELIAKLEAKLSRRPEAGGTPVVVKVRFLFSYM